VQAMLHALLTPMIPLAVTVSAIGDEPPRYLSLLTELLQTVDLGSTLVDTVVRFVSVLMHSLTLLRLLFLC